MPTPAPHESSAPRRVVHMLSFDVEEYFQVEAAAEAGLSPDQWSSFPKRLPPAVDCILELLADAKVSATFFVLGWVARHEPEIVRTIAAAGHEIASHGTTHTMLTRLTPQQFRRELTDSRHLLQDISSQPIIGYRAATFSILRQTAWAFDVLAEEGYIYDSSVYPVSHDRYGIPDAPRHIHRAVGPAGRSVLEIPPLTLRLLRRNWPVGGGGYLRLLPIRIIGQALRASQAASHPAMLYMHPWEFDPAQPPLPMARLSTFRHRVGLARAEKKLRWLLKRFPFASVQDRLDSLTETTSRQYSPD